MHVGRFCVHELRWLGGWVVAVSACSRCGKSADCGDSRVDVPAGLSVRRFAEKAVGTHWLSLGSALVEPWERLG